LHAVDWCVQGWNFLGTPNNVCIQAERFLISASHFDKEFASELELNFIAVKFVDFVWAVTHDVVKGIWVES
jgi:hypothetical protein